MTWIVYTLPIQCRSGVNWNA